MLAEPPWAFLYFGNTEDGEQRFSGGEHAPAADPLSALQAQL